MITSGLKLINNDLGRNHYIRLVINGKFPKNLEKLYK